MKSPLSQSHTFWRNKKLTPCTISNNLATLTCDIQVCIYIYTTHCRETPGPDSEISQSMLRVVLC